MSAIERTRLQLSQNTDASKKSRLGQFLTPEKIASFMASLFPNTNGNCYLLDAGAGIGSLSAAFLNRWDAGDFHFQRVELDAFEIDDLLLPSLTQTLAIYDHNMAFTSTIYKNDFIQAASDWLSGNLFATPLPQYTHVILNPPYKKIHSASAHRLALRHVGIETVNMYSAFVALSVALTAPGGQIVAIIPRSFCNGPYYRPFRDFILGHTAIRQMHLFESRDRAFEDDEVLQETIIIRLERDGTTGPVTISTSTDTTFVDLVSHEYLFEQIVLPGDPERFIHVPTSPAKNTIELSPAIRYTLADLGIRVSTGPVVDFRLKEHLRDMPEPNSVPLLYPAHFTGSGIVWPMLRTKKPNAIARNIKTEKWLYPSGFYCVVRRFSSKEEKRRIMASVVDPGVFAGFPLMGFENHLNVFHENRGGLPHSLAQGLAVFLNTTAVDENFRRFNGHTQVNATDLKLMKYPSRDALIGLGEWAIRQGQLTQIMIDTKVETLAG